MKRTIFLILFSFVFLPFFSQTKDTYSAEIFGSVATGENTPFWILNQKWGIVPLDANNLYVRGGVFHEQTFNDNWSFDAGIDIVGATSSAYGNPWIQQLYGRMKWKIWRLDIGSREDYTSFLNPRLSSGDFVKSNNARPIPEIKGSIPEFIQIPYTKGNMYIKGDFAIGYYLDSRWKGETAQPQNKDYTKNIFFHHKSIYFRFGDMEMKNKMQFTVGMDHVAQWGGELYIVNYEGIYVVTNQPYGIDDFFRIAIAKEGASSSSVTDNAYVAGSQWGAYLLRWDYKLTEKDQLSVYTNHFFDDGSGMTFENYRDGLLGFEYKRKDKSLLSGAVFEYIYTKQQTAPIHHNILMDDEHRDKLQKKGNGNDNYYNNVDYVQGPSHFGRTMGTPLFLSPFYNKDGSLNFKSSRIIAFHLGLEGYLHPTFQYCLLLTTGKSWGRYYVPFKSVKHGFASQLELTYTPTAIEGLGIKLSAGYDKGEVFGGHTFGGGITLSKRGIIHEK
ncbi:MAG: capsule assembly Wzi family protein [Tannerella sp.]|jgi:hypothetical protein|nr:capsule assembly Wzi family protein [Tannerella sp.]